jgi:hypothetical protein
MIRTAIDTSHRLGSRADAVNRTQALILGFSLVAWIALVGVLVAAPEIYDSELKPLGLAGVAQARLGFLAGITGLLTLLAVGTLRRWRWLFWLVLIAFAAGILRVPLVGLQVARVLPLDVPLWYAALQALIGIVQVAIAAAMLIGYRRNGIWGRF